MKKLFSANWSYPTSVRFGVGRLAELPALVKESGITRPLFVTDSALASLDVTQHALGLVEAAGLAVDLFSEVRSNPHDRDIERGVEVFREGQHDGVIAFGGGSGLDAGKLIAFLSGQTRPIWDFEDIGDWWTRADPAGIAPVVAVPTTAGTGSEVGRAGVVTQESTVTKKVIFHPKMLPVGVICDPELTVSLPHKITVGTGFDALAHCLEAYCSPSYHPMAEGIAVEGLRLAFENLPLVASDPADLVARGHMMSAAAMGAAAFQKGLGAIHSLSHPVGALYNTHHGLTNAVFLPYVLAFNRRAIETKIARLAAYLDIADGFDGLLARVLALREDLGVPHTTATLGVESGQRDRLAEMAIVDPTAGGNPVELTEARARALLDAAFTGSVEDAAQIL